jgi:uncharacterized Zn-finger protein
MRGAGRGLNFAATGRGARLAASSFDHLAKADSTPHRATAPANTQQRYEVRAADLPLSCPLPSMALWNSHPRVYLPIAQEGGQAQCPYCGAHFVLVD